MPPDLLTAFLDDIVAHPRDPVPWLALADWLEECGDVRGEVVRLVRQLWDEPGHPDEMARYERCWDLLASGVRLPLPRHTTADGIDMVWVPPGCYWMGGGAGRCGEKWVRVPTPFYFGRYQVTQGQWAAVMGTNPSYFSRGRGGRKRLTNVPDTELGLFPVESVTWEDVQTFLARLNAREVDTGWAYRLPTEEEWEYAARSPVPSPKGVASQRHCSFSFYPGRPGNTLSSEQANFGDCVNRTTRVGSYQPNGIGLHDLHGNVCEWTQTADGPVRATRGGGWYLLDDSCAVASRGTLTKWTRGDFLGFRLARVPSP